MRKLFIVLAITTSLIYAQQDESSVGRNIYTSASGGKNVVNENKLEDIGRVRGGSAYEREVIYNYVKYYNSQKSPSGKPEKVALVNLVEVNNTPIPDDNINANDLVTIKGFCIVKDDVRINKQPASISTECNTNVGFITVFANLRPINEVSALILDPLYMDFKGYRYSINSTIATNEAKTSYNIATYVNDRKLAEIGYSGVMVASNEFKTGSNAYLRALEDSRTSSSVGYAPVGNSTDLGLVQTQQTTKPVVGDYLVTAGINVLTSIVQTTAEIMKADLPYLYEIKGGSRIYIDMQVNKQGAKI